MTRNSRSVGALALCCGTFSVHCTSSRGPDAAGQSTSSDGSVQDGDGAPGSGAGPDASSGASSSGATTTGASTGAEDGAGPSATGDAGDANPDVGSGNSRDAAVSAGGDGGGPAPGGAGFYPQDLSFTSTANKANPYIDVTDFQVTFTGPTGAKLVLPGFYTGGQVWKVRFAPTRAGTFTYVTSSVQDPSLNGLTGMVASGTPNPSSHGALHVDPALPHHYLYDDGARYFQMGYEVDWLGLMDFGDPSIAKAKTLIDMIAANGFTEVNMEAFAYDTSWKLGTTSIYDFGPPTSFPWAGTNAAADHTRMNEAYWQGYDRVVAYLFEKGLNVHIFCKFTLTYGAAALVSWPAKSTPEEDLYLRFLVARYQAYPNVIWDFMKESFYETDQAYMANRLNFIKASDAYHHLRTLHSSGGAQGQHSPNYYDVTAYNGTVDFDTDQFGAARSTGPTTQYATATAAWIKRAMPYENAEVTLYQIGNDGTFAYKGDTKESVFATNLEVLLAGGYFTYYYANQAWDIVRWNETPNAITWYKNLITFMKTTGWYNMAADDSLIGGGAVGKTHCLANPGKEYIVYTSGAGGVTLNVAGAAAALTAKWVDLYTGAESPLADQNDGSHVFTNPWPDPAFLYLVHH